MEKVDDASIFLGKKVPVKIDRPIGYENEQYGWSYPINYGFVPYTISGDDEELDVYVLGVDEPLEEFIGTCIALVKRTDDDDDKLIIVPEGITFTPEEIEKQVHFQEQWFKHKLMMM